MVIQTQGHAIYFQLFRGNVDQPSLASLGDLASETRANHLRAVFQRLGQESSGHGESDCWLQESHSLTQLHRSGSRVGQTWLPFSSNRMFCTYNYPDTLTMPHFTPPGVNKSFGLPGIVVFCPCCVRSNWEVFHRCHLATRVPWL